MNGAARPGHEAKRREMGASPIVRMSAGAAPSDNVGKAQPSGRCRHENRGGVEEGEGVKELVAEKEGEARAVAELLVHEDGLKVRRGLAVKKGEVG